MKPITKGDAPGRYATHRDAKADLIDRLGPYCSYCESKAKPSDLQVEHIYPQANTAHPKLARSWRNFLLACNRCNTFKRHYLGDGNQKGLLKRMLWPQIDNTARAFVYDSAGLVTVEPSLVPSIRTLASDALDLCGTLKSPATAARYKALGIAYGGVEERKEAWGVAVEARTTYLADPSTNLPTVINLALATGHFSVWMKVFRNEQPVRLELLKEAKASPSCYDASGNTVQRGRC